VAGIEPLAGRRCPRCAARCGRGERCPACHGAAPFARVTAVGPYAGVLREALHALKYRGVRGVAGPLAALAARALGTAPAGAVVVGVPAHGGRLAGRWLDHAALLADGVGAALRLQVQPRAMVRQRATRPQVGLDPAERAANLSGAFRASAVVRGARVVLVDDVMTTGATVREVSAALLAAGARSVDVCVVARADQAPRRSAPR